jgi:carbon-monoxide dehydrogenase medium subunit
MKPAPFDLHTAADLADATRLLAHLGDGAKPMSGSQSLGPMLNLRLVRPDALVSIGRADDLCRVQETKDAILYGAALTHAAFEDGHVPDATPGWLAPIARGIAYRAVRNRGTIGGSLAHADPAADWVVTLTALRASVIVATADGDIEIALPEFFTGPLQTALAPGQVIRAVRIPRRSAQARWGYWKFCRKVGEFAKASAAILIDPDRGETRLVAGAIDAPPILLADAAALVSGDGDIATAIANAVPDLSPTRRQLQVTATTRALAALTPSTGALT